MKPVSWQPLSGSAQYSSSCWINPLTYGSSLALGSKLMTQNWPIEVWVRYLAKLPIPMSFPNQGLCSSCRSITSIIPAPWTTRGHLEHDSILTSSREDHCNILHKNTNCAPQLNDTYPHSSSTFHFPLHLHLNNIQSPIIFPATSFWLSWCFPGFSNPPNTFTVSVCQCVDVFPQYVHCPSFFLPEQYSTLHFFSSHVILIILVFPGVFEPSKHA